MALNAFGDEISTEPSAPVNAFGDPVETKTPVEVNAFGDPVTKTIKRKNTFGDMTEEEVKPGHKVLPTAAGIDIEVADFDEWQKQDAKPFNLSKTAEGFVEGVKQVVPMALKGAGKMLTPINPLDPIGAAKEHVKRYTSVAEGGVQNLKAYGQGLTNIGSAIADKFYSPEEEKVREYNRYVEGEAQKQIAQAGVTDLSTLARRTGEATGVDTTKEQEFVKDVDQDVVGFSSIATDPLNALGFGAGALNKVMKLGRAGAISKLETTLAAAVSKADKVKIAEIEKAIEAVKAAPESAFEKVVEQGAKVMEKIPSPTEGALWSAGHIAKGIGSGAKTVAGKLENVGPLTQTAIGAGIGYAQGDSLESAIIGGVTGRALGKLQAEANTLRNFGGRMTTAGETASRVKDAFAVGGKDTRSLAQQAFIPGIGEKTQDVLLNAAKYAPGSIQDRMMGSAIRSGMFFGRDVVDPAVKGMAIGGAFGLAMDPTEEGLGAGMGQGMMFSLGGRGLERAAIKMAGRNPIVDQKYVDAMREQLPEMDRQALDASPLGPTEKAMLVETYYKTRKTGKDAEVHFVPSDEAMLELLIKDSGKTREELAAEIMPPLTDKPDEKRMTRLESLEAQSKSNGMFVPAKIDGKFRTYINTQRADSGVLSHEGSHSFDMVAPGTKSKSTQALYNFLLGTPEVDPNTQQITGYKGGFLTDPALIEYLREQYDPEGVYQISTYKGEDLRKAIAGEVKADGEDQFSRRALAKNMTLQEYQDFVLKYRDNPEKLGKLLEEMSGGKRGYYDSHAAGASVLFKNQDGSSMINPPELEIAIAEAHQERAATKEYTTLKDADGGTNVVLDTRELSNEAKAAKDAIKKSRGSNNIQEILAAEKQMKDLTESGIYATMPRTDVERNMIAAKIVTIEQGPEALKGPNADALLEEAKTRVAQREIKFEPGNRPIFVTAKEAQKFADRFGQHVHKAMMEVGDSLEENAMKMVENPTTGERFFRGRYFDDNQLAKIKLIPDEILPQHIKDNLEFINERAKNGYGDVLNIVYQAALKGGKYNAKAERSFRKAVPLSMSISKAGNFLVSTFDVTGFNHALDLEMAKPHSRVLENFEGDTLQEKRESFTRDAYKYMLNHAEGRPGRIGLAIDDGAAKRKADAINGLFGMNEKTWGDYIRDPEKHMDYADEKRVKKGSGVPNFFRSRRLDRIMKMSVSPTDSFPVVTEKLKANFMPGQFDITAFEDKHNSAVGMWGDDNLHRKIEELANLKSKFKSLVFDDDAISDDKVAAKISNWKSKGYSVLEDSGGSGGPREIILYKAKDGAEKEAKNIAGSEVAVDVAPTTDYAEPKELQEFPSKQPKAGSFKTISDVKKFVDPSKEELTRWANSVSENSLSPDYMEMKDSKYSNVTGDAWMSPDGRFINLHEFGQNTHNHFSNLPWGEDWYRAVLIEALYGDVYAPMFNNNYVRVVSDAKAKTLLASSAKDLTASQTKSLKNQAEDLGWKFKFEKEQPRQREGWMIQTRDADSELVQTLDHLGIDVESKLGKQLLSMPAAKQQGAAKNVTDINRARAIYDPYTDTTPKFMPSLDRKASGYMSRVPAELARINRELQQSGIESFDELANSPVFGEQIQAASDYINDFLAKGSTGEQIYAVRTNSATAFVRGPAIMNREDRIKAMQKAARVLYPTSKNPGLQLAEESLVDKTIHLEPIPPLLNLAVDYFK